MLELEPSDIYRPLTVIQYDQDLTRATGALEVHEDFMSNLSRISQLTGPFLLLHLKKRVLSTNLGFSDPIYAEAYVKMHGFDILLGEPR